MPRLVASLLFAFCLAVGSASADPLILTLTPDTYVGSPGQTIPVTATYTNTGPTDIQVNAFSSFFINLPFAVRPPTPSQYSALVPANSSVAGRTLISFQIPADFGGALPQTFSGTLLVSRVSLVPGVPSISSNFATVSLTIVPVPEPATALMLAAGLAGAAGTLRRRRRE